MLMKHTVQMYELSHKKWQEISESSPDSHIRLSYVYDKSIRRIGLNRIVQISEQDQIGSVKFVNKIE